jgi:type IV secretion system protein VirB4
VEVSAARLEGSGLQIKRRQSTESVRHDDGLRSDGALAEATSGDVHFCYLSSSIVLQHKDRNFLENIIGEFRKVLINRGFGVRVEDINAVDAFFGTLPGNGVAQVRRVIAHTRNYVDLMPISAVRAGEKKNPSSLMPPNSPPLLYAATQGGVPYRLNLHDYDVGHTLLIGPTVRASR